MFRAMWMWIINCLGIIYDPRLNKYTRLYLRCNKLRFKAHVFRLKSNWSGSNDHETILWNVDDTDTACNTSGGGYGARSPDDPQRRGEWLAINALSNHQLQIATNLPTIKMNVTLKKIIWYYEIIYFLDRFIIFREKVRINNIFFCVPYLWHVYNIDVKSNAISYQPRNTKLCFKEDERW